MNQILNTLKTKYEANREEYRNIRENVKQITANGFNSMTKEEWLIWDRYIKAIKILEGEARGLSFAFDEIVKSMGLSLIPKTIITIRKEDDTVVFVNNVVVEAGLRDFVKGQRYSSEFIIHYVGENKYKMEVEREEISIEKWVIPK